MDLFPASTQFARDAGAVFLTTLLNAVQRWCFWIGDTFPEYESFFRGLLADEVTFPFMDPRQIRASIIEKTKIFNANRKKNQISFIYVTCYQYKNYYLQHAEGPEVAAALDAYRQLLNDEMTNVDSMDPETADRIMEGLEEIDAVLALQPAKEPVAEQASLLDFPLNKQPMKGSPQRAILDIAFQPPSQLAFELPEPPAQPQCEEVDSEGEEEAMPPQGQLTPSEFTLFAEEFVSLIQRKAVAFYESAVKDWQMEDVEEIKEKLAAAEKKAAEYHRERKDSESSENDPPPSRMSMAVEELYLSLPPQDDTFIKDESPRFQKSASENFGVPVEPQRVRRVMFANEATYLETPLLKAGTLYRSGELELSAKTTLVNSVCYLTLIHRNCGNTPLSDLSIALRPWSDSSLSFSAGSFLDNSQLDPGSQGIELLQCSCSGVLTESPSVTVSYTIQCVYKEICLKLPISVASFMTGVAATVEQIVEAYSQWAEYQSSCRFARYKAKIANREILEGFVAYQKSFTVVNPGEAAEVGGIGELKGRGTVVFFIKKMDSDYELRCRSPDAQLRDAVLRFLIGLISA